MRQKIALAFALVVVSLSGGSASVAQNAAHPSLQEQLEAQYPLTQMKGNTLVRGAVLVLQKEGVFGVPQVSLESPRAAYKNGVLHPPDADMLGHFGKDSRALPKGGKVYVLKIDVNLANDRIKFFILECGACGGAVPSGSFKSVVSFEFARGYLRSAGVLDVEDTIAQVFDIYTPAEAPPLLPQPPGQTRALPGQMLSNDDIIKLVQAKLPDSLIATNIRSSTCTFDVSAAEFDRLKRAGVSDTILQAMVDAVNQPARAPLPTSSLSARGVVMTRDYQSAVSEYTELLRRDPDSAEYYDRRAMAYSRLGQLDLAISDLSQIIRLNPNKSMPYYHRAALYLRAGEVKAAIQDLDRSIELAPDSVPAHMLRARAFDQQNELRRELEDLDAVIRLSPPNPLARRLREQVAQRLRSNATTPVEGAHQDQR